MQTAQRTIGRLAKIGAIGLFLCAAVAGLPARAATPAERVLPDSTVFMFKMNDTKSFREAFRLSEYGRLWSDPGLKEFKDELFQRLEEKAKWLKENIGLGLKDLFDIPQGQAALAAVSREDADFPIAAVLVADVGENQRKVDDALSGLRKQADDFGRLRR